MAKNKTTETKESVSAYLAKITDDKRRKDCAAVIEQMSKSTGLEPKMWGSSIVGFGSYHYTYDSGHEGDAPLAGMSSRANAIVLYFGLDPEEKDGMLEKLGKHKAGKGCIYIKKLEDIDPAVLSKMAKHSVKFLKQKYRGQ